MAKYKATYQIGSMQVHNIWSKKKDWAEKKRQREEVFSLWKQKKKSMPHFPFPAREWGLWAGHIWCSPTGKSWLWNPTFVYLKDRQGMLSRPLQVKLFCQGSSGDIIVWDFSAPDCEWTCNCLKGQYLSSNGLFGTVVNVAAIDTRIVEIWYPSSRLVCFFLLPSSW